MWKIVLAAVLSIPCLTVIICTAPIIAVLAIPSLLLLLLRKESSGISSSNPPDHVIIAGGSSGIGLCIARECLKRGVSKITLLARDMKKLESVQQELQTISKEGKSRTKIHIISVSVSDYEQIERAAKENIQWKKSDRVVLFNCAGISYTTEFEKIPHNTLLKLVQTNQLGSMFLVKACLPYLEQGVICLTSSVAGQAAVYGYAGYNPTKCAIRGFAEVMTQELLMAKPKLHIQVAYPEDNKTPGYEYESKMMPEITKKMNETAPLADPKDTAKVMINAAFQSRPKFAVYFSVVGWAVSNVTAGFGPVVNLGDALAQVSLLSLFRWIALFVLNDFWRIIRDYDESKKDKKGD